MQASGDEEDILGSINSEKHRERTPKNEFLSKAIISSQERLKPMQPSRCFPASDSRIQPRVVEAEKYCTDYEPTGVSPQ